MDTYIYPAVFSYADDGISISFPDLPGCLSCADSEFEAIESAREVLGLYMHGLEEDNDEIPEPTSLKNITLEDNDIAVLVDVYMPVIRNKIKNIYVKKTLTLPAWLNIEAEKAGINFSQLLQKAIKNSLHLQD